MNERNKHPKIVEWSEEDQLYIGHCPGVIGPCCHGKDKDTVYKELCGIVNEWLEIESKDVSEQNLSFA